MRDQVSQVKKLTNWLNLNVPVMSNTLLLNTAEKHHKTLVYF